MKKIMFTAVFALVSVAGAMAQSILLDNPGNHTYFSIQAGGEVVCPGTFTTGRGTDEDLFKTGGGASLGVVLNVPLVANLYIEPGVKFWYDSYSVDKDKAYLVATGANSISLRKFGFRIPVMVGYHLDFTPETKLALFTGPELSVPFTGRTYYKSVARDYDRDLFNHDELIAQKRYDVQWTVGVGLTWRRLYFGVSGSFGLTNIMDGRNNPSMHENRATFTVGYNIPMKTRGRR